MSDYDPTGPGGMSSSDAAPTTSSSSSSGSSSSSRSPKKKSKGRSAIEAAGRSLNESSVDDLREQAREAAERIPSYRKGGTKRGDGKARLHKNERIMAPKRKKGRMRRKGGRA